MLHSILLDVLVCCIIAYFICGIPFGLLVAKKEENVDVREHGSGNIGSTNVARTAGAKAGFITLVLDSSKSFLSVKLAEYILVNYSNIDPQSLVPAGNCSYFLAWVFFFCILGHVYSPYLHFNGGKGVATGLGGCLAFMPTGAAVAVAVFLAVVIPTRYVSLGSVLAATSLPFIALFVYKADISTIVPLALVALVIIFAHRQNIKRLIAGKESKFKFADK